METMKAFWRYDWALNRARLITVVVIAALWPWAMVVSILAKEWQERADWTVFVVIFTSLAILAIPGLLVGYVSDLARTGAPSDFRHFSCSLPVDRGRWALAKVVSALGWGVVAPAFLLAVMTALTACIFGKAESSAAPEDIRKILSGLLLVSVASAGTLGSLFCGTLMPRGQSCGAGVFLGAAVSFCGEMLVRGVTGIRAFEQSMRRLRAPGESVSEIGLCLLLTVVLALIFVRYHKNRRAWQAAVLGLVALVVVDGARAWLWR